MDTKKVLDIVLREMNAYGQAWRLDWSDFDGRSLRGQLSSIATWADEAVMIDGDCDYTSGTEFLAEMTESVGG
jgi:hypothetical protein